MAVPINVANDGHAVDIGAAVQLFATHVSAISGINVRQECVVSPDGQRFLIDSSLQPLSPIAVVLNWKPTP